MQDLYKKLRIKTVRAALVVVVVSYCSIAKAQVLVLDATDRPIMPKEYVNLKGSPFLYNEWVKGTVRLTNGIEYSNIYLMYDQVKDELNFTYKDGKVQKFIDPVARFTVGDKEFRRDIFTGRKPGSEEFFEVLVDGDVKLLKRTSKKVIEEINHAVATKDKRIHTVTSYFLVIEDDLIKVKQNKSAIIKALGAHKSALATHIQNEKLNLKVEQDMMKLIAYFNTLMK